tara:strand:+ start:61 stop:216 length:156 start_codon:yes stop_codon:yes gene_type:complete
MNNRGKEDESGEGEGNDNSTEKSPDTVFNEITESEGHLERKKQFEDSVSKE